MMMKHNFTYYRTTHATHSVPSRSTQRQLKGLRGWLVHMWRFNHRFGSVQGVRLRQQVRDFRGRACLVAWDPAEAKDTSSHSLMHQLSNWDKNVEQKHIRLEYDTVSSGSQKFTLCLPFNLLAEWAITWACLHVLCLNRQLTFLPRFFNKTKSELDEYQRINTIKQREPVGPADAMSRGFGLARQMS